MKVDGKLARIVNTLTSLLDQESPDVDQVRLKFRSATSLASGRALHDIMGDTYWEKLQKILHPGAAQSSAGKPLAA